MNNFLIMLLLLTSAPALAGVHSVTSAPFLLQTSTFPSASSAIAAPIVLNTFDIATSAIGMDVSQAFPLDTNGDEQLVPLYGTVSGYVRGSNGVPIPNALVTITRTGATTTSQYQGAYSFQNVLAGGTILHAEVSGYAMESSLTVQPGTNHQIDFTFQMIHTLTFRVRQGNGMPLYIEGARVIMTSISPQQFAETDGNGQAAFQLPNGTYSYRVEKSGMEAVVGQVALSTTQDRLVHLSPVQQPVPVHVFAVRGFDASCAGYLDDDAGGWAPLRDALASRYPAVVFHPVTINPAGALASNANALSQQIESSIHTADAKIVLVGHSMGGLICRKYLATNQTGRVEQVDRLFTIDTPHQGASLASAGHFLDYFGDLINPFPNLSEDCPALSVLDAWSSDWLNESMMEGELMHNVDYVFLGGVKCKYHFENLCFPHDGVVGLESQLGTDCSQFDFCFDENGYHITRMLFSTQEGFFGWFQPHMRNMQHPEMIQFIINYMNVPFNEIPDMPPSRSDPASPTVRVGYEAAILPPGVQRIIQVNMPAAATQSWTAAASGSFNWNIQSASGASMSNEAEVEAANGLLDVSEDGLRLNAQFMAATQGPWSLTLGNPGPDSLAILVDVFADAQFRLEALPASSDAHPALGNPLQVAVHQAEGLVLDSLVAATSDGQQWRLHDDGQAGDALAGDMTFTARLLGLAAGCHALKLEANIHGQQGSFRVTDFVERCLLETPPYEVLATAMIPVDADSNGRFESLEAHVSLFVHQAMLLEANARLVAVDSTLVANTAALDSFTVGENELVLAFSGGQIQDAGLNGPYLLDRLSLTASGVGGWTTTADYLGLATSAPLLANDFVDRMPPVQELSAWREVGNLHVTWRPHDSLDLSHYLLFYDTDGEAPYEGAGLAEGASPIQVISQNAITLTGADPQASYTFVVVAVDIESNQSGPSLPYTVFPLTTPDAIVDLQLNLAGSTLVLLWSAVEGGAQYQIQWAANWSGPWSVLATTYQTMLSLPFPDGETQRFFRVVANR